MEWPLGEKLIVGTRLRFFSKSAVKENGFNKVLGLCIILIKGNRDRVDFGMRASLRQGQFWGCPVAHYYPFQGLGKSQLEVLPFV